jgi:serine/threonine-protein kinase RsbW
MHLKPWHESLIWLDLPARMDALAALRAFALERATALGMSEQVCARIDLVLEEVLLNIFYHAYKGEPGQVRLGCGRVPGQGFVVRVMDQGQLFDPLQREAPDTTGPIEDRPIGGLGVLLARQMSSAMAYHRQDNSNVLDIFFQEA